MQSFSENAKLYFAQLIKRSKTISVTKSHGLTKDDSFIMQNKMTSSLKAVTCVADVDFSFKLYQVYLTYQVNFYL